MRSSSANAHDDFVEFANGCGSRLFRAALALTADWHAAEDLTQTTLAKVYASWARVRKAADPLAYARGILVKTWLSQRRRLSSQERPTADHEDRAAPDAEVDERLVVVAVLRELRPMDRAVLVLRFFEDRSIAETAIELGLSSSAVTTATTRALARARQAFEARGIHGVSVTDELLRSPNHDR